MKRTISFLLALLITCNLLCTFTWAQSAEIEDDASPFVIPGEDAVPAGNTQAKLHFYIDNNEKYYDIYDAETCIEAFQYMRDLHDRIVLKDESIKITIKFTDDITETEEFSEKSLQVSVCIYLCGAYHNYAIYCRNIFLVPVHFQYHQRG